MTDPPDPPAGPDYPQGSPQPGDRPVPGPYNADRHRLAAVVLRAAAIRAPRELDSSDLTITGGDSVQIVCVAEVIDWLEGLAIRVQNGEGL